MRSEAVAPVSQRRGLSKHLHRAAAAALAALAAAAPDCGLGSSSWWKRRSPHVFVIRGSGERVERKREDGKAGQAVCGEGGGEEADVAARCGCSCRAPPQGGAATPLGKVTNHRLERQTGVQRDSWVLSRLEGPSGKTEFELIPGFRPKLIFPPLCLCTGLTI